VNFDPQVREYDDSSHKLLHEQRERYIAQSAHTRDGFVPDFAQLMTEKEPQQ
jgi:hypothetical protein